MTTETQTETEQPQDLHSVLASAFDAAEAKGKPAETPEPKAEPDAKAAEETDSKADSGGEKTPDAPGAQSKPEEADDAKPGDAAKAEQKLEAPAHWPAHHKAAFAKAPPEMQQAWLQRDKEIAADYTKKTTEIATFKKDWEPVDKMFEPYRAEMKARGFTNESLIRSWMNAELALMNGGDNAYNLLAQVVKQYRLDPAALAQKIGVSAQGNSQPAAKEEQKQPQLPPEITAALQPVLAEINGVKQWITAEQQTRYQNEAGRVMNEIQKFSEAKDDKGNLLHPYFPDIENHMAQIAGLAKASGKPVNLQELYDQAVWANTSTREKLLADRSAADEAQRKAMAEKQAKETRAKAEAARKASKPVSGAPGSGQPPSTSRAVERSLRDTIMAAAEDADL